ncbi:MAG: prepilin peptidase [Deltaproteobacteria bacterium]|nr:prepilin peptidase [Deltaproteobacteria bacterium]
MIKLILFVFGSCIGSFLNVCIYRLPNSKSIVYPPSACPGCQAPIRFYDNIPILSFLLLRGKCRSCQASISIRYPMIELMAGLFAVCVYLKFGLTPEALITYLLIASLVVITFIDLDHRIIPDAISLPGIPIGFAASFFSPAITYMESLMGILVGGGSLLLVAWVYNLITHKEGMGGGDIKLLAMIGAFVGWQGVLLTIFLSSAIGTLCGLLVMLRSGKNMKMVIPFGPFLAMGAMIHIFFGRELIFWYFYTFT